MGQSLSFLKLPFAYLRWHFTAAWGDLWRVYTNVSWFLWNLFSIRILASTLVSPWRRLSEGKSKGSAGLLGKLIINALTRIFGLIVRVGTILAGLAALFIWTALYAGLFAVWIILPLAAPVFMLLGLGALLTAFLP